MRAVVQRLQRLSDEHWWALDASCRLMERNAWVGPMGVRFDHQIRADQRELRDLLVQALHSAQRKLAALPDLP
ncbi:hypothetical protein [Nonomuraea sp. NPDC050783]|uniref:hypothetical protein n=1 Tax=Nonomuraea sp. NPDC050783 TaxID=3154634 RepID=UPI0034678A19